MKNIPHLLEIATFAALEAGKAIMEIYNSGEFTIETKPDDSPLTKADRISHTIITKHLEITDLPVLSEEGMNKDFSNRNNWEYFWLVDPLDGTKEFINKNGEFTINIALVLKNIPIEYILDLIIVFLILSLLI